MVGVIVGALGGGSAGVLADPAAEAKLRELAPDVALVRADVSVNADGVVVADLHKQPLATPEAIAAGFVSRGWVDRATCAADTLTVLATKCSTVVEDRAPKAWKQ